MMAAEPRQQWVAALAPVPVVKPEQVWVAPTAVVLARQVVMAPVEMEVGLVAMGAPAPVLEVRVEVVLEMLAVGISIWLPAALVR